MSYRRLCIRCECRGTLLHIRDGDGGERREGAGEATVGGAEGEIELKNGRGLCKDET